MRWSRRKLGREGEGVARRFLEGLGYQILATNFTCPSGEIDIICFHDGCIVFVEVKTRTACEGIETEPIVSIAQQRHAEKAARAWLSLQKEPDCQYRFDVVVVQVSEGAERRVDHIVEAFVPRR